MQQTVVFYKLLTTLSLLKIDFAPSLLMHRDGLSKSPNACKLFIWIGLEGISEIEMISKASVLKKKVP